MCVPDEHRFLLIDELPPTEHSLGSRNTASNTHTRYPFSPPLTMLL